MRIRKRPPPFSLTLPSYPPLFMDPLLRRRTEVQFLGSAAPAISGDDSREKPVVISDGEIGGGSEGFFGATEEDEKKGGKQCTVGRGGGGGDEGDAAAAIDNSRDGIISGAAVGASPGAIPASTKGTSGGVSASSSSSAPGVNISSYGGGGAEAGGGDRCFPLKKRKGVMMMMQEPVQGKGKTNNQMKTKTKKKQDDDDDDDDDEEEEKRDDEDYVKGRNGNGVAMVRKKGRGGAHMEGSRCSRVNGRGWRCCQQTLVGYSLCEHHLGKGRLRSLTSVRSSSSSAPKSSNLTPPPEWSHSSRLDADEEYDYRDESGEDDSDYENEDGSKKKRRKKNRIGMVKARLLSSLLDQPEPGVPAAMPYLSQGIAEEEGEISEGVLRRSIHAIEEEFMAYVESKMEENPMITASGTCCLLGVISGNELFLAQVGDSRAVMGVYDRSTDDMFPVQLTQDHNVCDAELRGRMWSHHHDPNVVFVRRGCWRVRGMVQANRSIGDAYLKLPELTVAPKHEMYELHAPLRRGVVSGEPCVERRELGMEDRYVIFGTNGLWDLISNEDAVEIVRRNERKGIAKKLVSFALMKAAWEAGMEERELWNLNAGARRHFHDDITVVVVFIDGEMFERPRLLPWLCVTGGVGSEVGSVLGVWGDD